MGSSPSRGPRYAGVDTHKERHVVAVLEASTELAEEFDVAATAAGYRECSARLRGLGVSTVAVEGCSSWGKGLAGRLAEDGFEVVEALRPGRRPFAQAEKTDASDAERAALCALFGMGSEPKDASGAAGEVAAMLCARELAVADATALSNAALSQLDTAPEPLRARYRGMPAKAVMRALARSRPRPGDALGLSLRSLARIWAACREEADALEAAMGAVLEASHPSLLSAFGVGTISAAKLVALAGDNPGRFGGEAAFARACGACPVPASSGKVARHRLSRGGDRRANSALHQIALSRMRHDERTRAYIERRMSERKTKREAVRCLVRYIAREVYRLIMADAEGAPAPAPAPAGTLRERRGALGLTLEQVAAPLGSYPAAISRLERGLRANPALRARYEGLLDRLEAGEDMAEICRNAPLQR